MEILQILFSVVGLTAEVITALSLLYLAYLEWRKSVVRDLRPTGKKRARGADECSGY
jgi:hypothetical protein